MYRLFDATVACEFALPGVPEANSDQADCCIILGQGSASEAGYDWLHSWREEGGELVLSCARKQEGGGVSCHLLRFPDLADFVIDGATVTCYTQPGCRDDTLRHLLLDQVIPRVWAHRGNLVLHASAVQLPDGRVIAFLGESGWGKSTLAAALQGCGSRLISDDSVWIRSDGENVLLVPSYTGLRLNEDSINHLGLAVQGWASVSHYSDKLRYERAIDKHQLACVLDTLFVMKEPGLTGAPLSINSLSGAGLIATLIKRSFLLDPRDNHSATLQLQEAGAVARALRVCSLEYPRDYLQLPTVCAALLGGGLQ